MTQPIQPSPQSQEMLNALRRAVADALEKKRRLGQYAVVWEDGRPVMLGGEAGAAPSSIVVPGSR